MKIFQRQWTKTKFALVMGDFNAKLGKELNIEETKIEGFGYSEGTLGRRP